MKKLAYYLILATTFVTILFLCSLIVSLLFNDPGSIVYTILCFVVFGIIKFIQPIIKDKMNI